MAQQHPFTHTDSSAHTHSSSHTHTLTHTHIERCTYVGAKICWKTISFAARRATILRQRFSVEILWLQNLHSKRARKLAKTEVGTTMSSSTTITTNIRVLQLQSNVVSLPSGWPPGAAASSRHQSPTSSDRLINKSEQANRFDMWLNCSTKQSGNLPALLISVRSKVAGNHANLLKTYSVPPTLESLCCNSCNPFMWNLSSLLSATFAIFPWIAMLTGMLFMVCYTG